MEERKCRTCHKVIQDPTRKNYCSIECNPNYRGIRGVSVTCKQCGKEFKRKTLKQMFCSAECRHTHLIENPKTGENAGHWQGGNIQVTCTNCGKEFEVRPYITKTRKNIFCSRTCLGEWSSKNRLGNKASNWKGGNITKICVVCGKEFEVNQSTHKAGGGKCCSNQCRHDLKSMQMCGDGNPMYETGSSKYPYCEKFNAEFKKRVRAFFDNKCILCGTTQDGNEALLSVHHVYANKTACCDNTPQMFAPLCRSCHSTISNHERYNKDIAEEYIQKIINIITNDYNGKCYYTREEFYKKY